MKKEIIHSSLKAFFVTISILVSIILVMGITCIIIQPSKEERAIELAKEYLMNNNSLNSPGDLLAYVKDILWITKGKIDPIANTLMEGRDTEYIDGWVVLLAKNRLIFDKGVPDHIYMVSFSVLTDEGFFGYRLEVDIKNNFVRSINGNDELKAKYEL